MRTIEEIQRVLQRLSGYHAGPMDNEDSIHFYLRIQYAEGIRICAKELLGFVRGGFPKVNGEIALHVNHRRDKVQHTFLLQSDLRLEIFNRGTTISDAANCGLALYLFREIREPVRGNAKRSTEHIKEWGKVTVKLDDDVLKGLNELASQQQIGAIKKGFKSQLTNTAIRMYFWYLDGQKPNGVSNGSSH